MMQGCYYEESLTGQRQDRVQTESQIATVGSCFHLFGPRQHGVGYFFIIINNTIDSSSS